MCTVHVCARAHLLQDPSLKTATVQARSPGTRTNAAEHCRVATKNLICTSPFEMFFEKEDLTHFCKLKFNRASLYIIIRKLDEFKVSKISQTRSIGQR